MNTINEGGTATYTVAVRGYVDPAADAMNPTAAQSFTVTLGIPSPDTTDAATEGEPADLNSNAHVLVATFNTPTNASTTNPLLFTQSKTISLATLHDNDAENEAFTLVFTLSGDGGLDQGADNDDAIALGTGAANPTALTIDDDETQGYTLALTPGQTTGPTEGVPFTVDLKASPAHEDGTGTMNVIIDKQTGWTLGIGDSDNANPAIVTAGSPDNTVELTITQTAGDRNRVTDTVTVSAHTGVAGASKEVASLSIDVADANLLQAVTAKVVDADGVALSPQPESVEEGKSVKIAVMPLDKDGKVTNANEELTIALASSGTADAADFRLSAPIKITSGQPQSNTVDLMIETDEDVGMESLMLDATVSGEAANGSETSTSEGVLSLYITDVTEKKIEPKGMSGEYPPEVAAALEAGQGEDGMLNPGEMVEIMTADLFTVMDGYTASYGVSVEGDAVSASASGEMVNITAMKAGESVVMITGTARMSSSFEVSQSVSNVAEVKFKLTVVDMPLDVHLDMPDNVMDGNIVEGETYMIPVHANRKVTEAEGSVEVMIMRDRSASDADDDDFTVGSATIMAGYDSAEAELMVTEDMMDDAGHDAGEVLVLYGAYGDDMETNDLTFTIWDAAVPALPLIAQLLLALFLALGGARLYRRRQG